MRYMRLLEPRLYLFISILDQGCEKMKHTVPQIVPELDKNKFSAYPSELIQMFCDHEDIIINSNEVRNLYLSPHNL